MHSLQLEQSKRILLVSIDNVGDAVFTSVITDALTQQHVKPHITVWSKDYTRDVAAVLPGVNHVIASDPFWDRSPGRGRGGFFAFIRTFLQLKEFKADIAICTSNSWRAAMTLWLLGIPVRIGFAHPKAARWLTHTVAAEDKQKPIVGELARLLEPFGIKIERPAYRLALPHTDQPNETLPRGFWALHPFAGHPRRRVPLPTWIEFAQRLKEEFGATLLWFGTKKELAELRSMSTQFQPNEFCDYYADSSLSDILRVLVHARAFIGHDSGPLHCAAGLGVACIGVYAPYISIRTDVAGQGVSLIIKKSQPSDVTLDDFLNAVRDLQTRMNSV